MADPVFVEVLTDEELSVLARSDDLAVRPHLEELAPEARDAARRAAYRSLVARGIVDPPTAEDVARAAGSREDVPVQLRQDIASVLTLRDAAEMVVIAARTTATSQDFWYAYAVAGVALLEEVSGDGMHRFALAERADLPALVVDAAVYPEAGDPPADATAVDVPIPAGDPTPPDALLEQLGAAFVRVDLVVRRIGDVPPPLLGLFSGPSGCWLVESAPGVTTLEAVPLSVAALRQRIEDEVTRADSEAGHGG